LSLKRSGSRGGFGGRTHRSSKGERMAVSAEKERGLKRTGAKTSCEGGPRSGAEIRQGQGTFSQTQRKTSGIDRWERKSLQTKVYLEILRTEKRRGEGRLEQKKGKLLPPEGKSERSGWGNIDAERREGVSPKGKKASSGQKRIRRKGGRKSVGGKRRGCPASSRNTGREKREEKSARAWGEEKSR